MRFSTFCLGMTKYISTKGNQYMNKQHWNDLSKAEQAQFIVDGLETGLTLASTQNTHLK